MPVISLGNILTLVGMVFFAGGAWVAIKQGLADVKQSQTESTAAVNDRLDRMSSEIASIREKYISKELDNEREKLFDAKIQRLADKVVALEEKRQAEISHIDSNNRRKRRT